MTDLKSKSDIEIIAMVSDLEKQQMQIHQALEICRQEVMRRVNEFKKQKSDGTDSSN
jgi:hypothetical protein